MRRQYVAKALHSLQRPLTLDHAATVPPRVIVRPVSHKRGLSRVGTPGHRPAGDLLESDFGVAVEVDAGARDLAEDGGCRLENMLAMPLHQIPRSWVGERVTV